MLHSPRTAPVVVAALLVACGQGAPAPVLAPPPIPSDVARRPASPPPPPDPLGGRPEVSDPGLFAPKPPVSYRRPNGMDVWLIERHELPIVAVHVVVPYGSSGDPKGKEGLAYITAGMLDEGAGSRGALELARAIDLLGATLRTGAYTDHSVVSLTALKKTLSPALAILGDVVVRPRFLPAEFRRVHDLWTNDLAQKTKDPGAVAQATELRVVFGEDHPYGHPVDGTARGAARIALADVTGFHGSRWRPDAATCVVVGDVTRDEVDRELDAALGAWAAPKTPAPPQPEIPAPNEPEAGRVVLVDRPDAPQAVVSLARPGVAASAPDAAALVRVNTALGGSFTSRLNQDLREDKGWTYGAKSRFSFTRGVGIFSAGAAVFTDKTGEAARALVGHVEKMAKEGLTDDEVQKTRLLARADLVETFEAVDATAARLARNAGVGLPLDHEITSAAIRDSVTRVSLGALAAKYVGKGAVLVVVGPRAVVEPQLRKAGFGAVTVVDAEGVKR